MNYFNLRFERKFLVGYDMLFFYNFIRKYHQMNSPIEEVRGCALNPSSWGFAFWSREDLIWRYRRHPERCFPAWGSHPL